MIDTVLFDLDNTILDFNKAERIALTRTLEQLGIPATEEVCARYSVLNLAQWKLLEKGEITRSEVKLRRYRLLFEELGADASPKEAAAVYEEFLGQGHYFMEGAEELLEALHGKYRLYLVTNGTASVQRGRIRSADLARYFEEIFISEDIGYNKPSVEYFNCCFERIPGFSKERTVIVGDSLTSDIQGGINAGIRTVWFCFDQGAGDESIQADVEIHKLSELPAALASLTSDR